MLWWREWWCDEARWWWCRCMIAGGATPVRPQWLLWSVYSQSTHSYWPALNNRQSDLSAGEWSELFETSIKENLHESGWPQTNLIIRQTWWYWPQMTYNEIFYGINWLHVIWEDLLPLLNSQVIITAPLCNVFRPFNSLFWWYDPQPYSHQPCLQMQQPAVVSGKGLIKPTLSIQWLHCA